MQARRNAQHTARFSLWKWLLFLGATMVTAFRNPTDLALMVAPASGPLGFPVTYSVLPPSRETLLEEVHPNQKEAPLPNAVHPNRIEDKDERAARVALENAVKMAQIVHERQHANWRATACGRYAAALEKLPACGNSPFWHNNRQFTPQEMRQSLHDNMGQLNCHAIGPPLL